MSKIVHEKMTQLCVKIAHGNSIKWSILERVTVFKQFFHFIWDKILACSIGKPARYRRLTYRSCSPPPEAIEAGVETSLEAASCRGFSKDSDLVSLKISLLGDCQIGKTSFVVSLYDLFFIFFSFFILSHGLAWLVLGLISFIIPFFFLMKIKYVGDEQEKKCLEMTGLSLMDKTLFVQGARISFSIWDVAGIL